MREWIKTKDRYPEDGESVWYFFDILLVGKGTVNGAPTLDIQMEDANGNKYMALMSGGMLESINGACKGLEARTNENQGDAQ